MTQPSIVVKMGEVEVVFKPLKLKQLRLVLPLLTKMRTLQATETEFIDTLVEILSLSGTRTDGTPVTVEDIMDIPMTLGELVDTVRQLSVISGLRVEDKSTGEAAQEATTAS
jgi:hypothetical protein